MPKVTKKTEEQTGKEQENTGKNTLLKRVKELESIFDQTYKKIPGKLLQKYCDTVRKHEKRRKELDESLDQINEELHAKWRKPEVKKPNTQSSKGAKKQDIESEEKKIQVIKLDTSSRADDTQVIVPKGCESEFDTTVLSLTNRRSKFLQHFYKLLVFNHPFENGFVKNNWFIGQVLRYQQEWRPAGFGLGELVKSFSLLPLEETTIELTVWEKTKSEIESISDVEKKSSEEESSKSTDSEEVTKESCKKKNWKVEASGSINFGIGSVGGGGGGGGSSEKHAKSMKSSIRESTRNTSSSISQKRSVKVGFATESGKESKTVRIINNTNRCHTVTFNFFQLLKLYDLVMTYEETPLALLFPSARKYASNKLIMEMYKRMHEAFTDFSSPFAFITQYFRIDPELGKALGYASPDPGEQGDLAGTALVFTTTPDPADPERTIEHLLKGLLYFFAFIVGDDLIPYEVETLRKIVEIYIENDIAMRNDDLNEVIDSLEIMTPGIYVDSMLGKCTACEDFIELSRANEAFKDSEIARELKLKNDLLETEKRRREALLEKGELDPFEPQPRKDENGNNEE